MVVVVLQLHAKGAARYRVFLVPAHLDELAVLHLVERAPWPFIYLSCGPRSPRVNGRNQPLRIDLAARALPVAMQIDTLSACREALLNGAKSLDQALAEEFSKADHL